MKICDICLLPGNGERKLRPVRVQVAPASFSESENRAEYELCDPCIDSLLAEIKRHIDLQKGGDVREACPSLTPSQAEQVRAFIAKLETVSPPRI